MNPQVSNPNDFKVVDFTNSTDFAFTPEMGCKYDGRPIFGITGAPGVNPGESIKLPYHIGHRLATNLAKMVMVKQAPTTDPAGIPTGVPLWSADGLEGLKNSFIKELYVEAKPIAQSETDKLMEKVEALNKMVEGLVSNGGVPSNVSPQPPQDNDHVAPGASQFSAPNGVTYQDKSDVITELEKKGITHDKRQSKANLEKLLVPSA